MTLRQKAYKKNLIQQIQIHKKDVFSSDEQRYDFMQSRFGVKSLKDMKINELKQFLDFCKRKVSDIQVNSITTAQKYKIKKLWSLKARNKEELALFAFILRVSKKEIKNLDDLDKSSAKKVLIALNRLKGG